MALSGSLSNPFKTGYRIQIDWSATQNVGANTSTITANFYLISTGGSYNINASAAKALSIVIDGTTYSYSVNVTVTGGQTKLLATATHTIAHNADGTRSFAISGSLGMNVTLSGTYYSTVSIAAVGFALNTIPRTSNATVSAASVVMGNAIAIYTNRASTAFSHNLSYSINGNVALIATGVTDSFSWVPPATLASLSPNSASAVCYIVCDTYSGGTYIGSSTTAFTIIVPDTIVPTISSVTIAEAVAGLATKFSGYVQYQSKVNVAIVAAGVSGSTITAYSTTVLGLTYPGASFVSGFLNTSGTVAVVTTVTDSRGRQKSVTNNITVISYFNPSISLFACQRCLASGTPNEDGTSLYANIKFDVATVNDKNDKTWKIEYRISGSGSWTQLTSGSSYTYDAIYKELTGKFSIDNAYELKLTITDYFGSVNTIVNLATAFTLLDFSASGKGFAIGQVSTADRFEVGMPTVFKDKAYLSEEDRALGADLYRVIQTLKSGWSALLSGDTLTYKNASACNTVNILGVAKDHRGYISVGMKLKLTQSGIVKYFFVTAVDATSITLYGGYSTSAYVITNDPITDVYFSVVESPLNFPNTVVKRRTFTIRRAMNLAGVQTISIGFRPTFVSIKGAAVNGGFTSNGSFDGITNISIFPLNIWYQDGYIVTMHTGNSLFGAYATFTPDGFTLTWVGINLALPAGDIIMLCDVW